MSPGDSLTPREREVLALIREGCSNEEIAERLGISLSGAKYHVSEILSKLGLENRHDAARWRPNDDRAPVVAPPRLRHRFGTWLSPAIAGALAVAIAIGAALLVWALISSRSDAKSSIALPTAQPGETMFVTADPGIQAIGHPELHSVTKSTGDPALIAAMRADLLALAGWPPCGEPCVPHSCRRDWGVYYHVRLLANGSLQLSADLDPTGCASANITIYSGGSVAEQFGRQAPTTAVVWDVIARVLEFPSCSYSDRIDPAWSTSCVPNSTPEP